MNKRPTSLLFYLFSAAMVVAFVFFVAYPGLFPYISSLTKASALQLLEAMLTSRRQGILLFRSITIAVGVSLLSTFIGATIALLLEHSQASKRKWIYLVMMVNFLIPSYIFTLAWIDLSGHAGLLRPFFPQSETARLPILYSSLGTMLVQSLSLYPIPALATAVAMRRLDSRFEEAGRLFASAWNVFCRITLPLVLPAVVTGALIVFLFSLVDFSVPSLLQVNTYPVEIYMQFSTSYDFNRGFIQSIPLVLIVLCALLLWRLFVKPQFGWLASSRESKTAGRFSGLWPSLAGLSVVSLSPGLPIAVMIWRAWPPISFVQAFMTAKEELLNSALTAALSATGVAFVAFSIAYLLRRRSPLSSPSLLSRTIRGCYIILSAIPFVISGPVLGIAMIRIWNHIGLRGAVYDSFFILSLACFARFFFIGERGVSILLGTIDPRIEHPALLAGVSSWGRLWKIYFPLCVPVIVVIWASVFIMSLGELGGSVLVAPPGFTPLAVRLYSLMHYGPSRLIAALSLIIVGAVGASTALAVWILRTMDRD